MARTTTNTNSSKANDTATVAEATTEHEQTGFSQHAFSKEAYQDYMRSLSAKMSEARHVFRQAYKAQVDLFMASMRVPGFERHVDQLAKTLKI